MQMKYDTNNIDEAAYLALQGYHFTVTRARGRSLRCIRLT